MPGQSFAYLESLHHFYDLLDDLDKKVGGKRQLMECDGQMSWPKRGVYFFFEKGEERSESGKGLRVVRVGTHAITNGTNHPLGSFEGTPG